jgi:hypothetical protein
MSISSPPQTPEQSSRWEFGSPPSANPTAEERDQRIKRLCEELSELKTKGLCEATAKQGLKSLKLLDETIENIQELVGRVDHLSMVQRSQELDKLCDVQNQYVARRLRQKISEKREELAELKMGGLCEATAKQGLTSQNLSEKNIETIQEFLGRVNHLLMVQRSRDLESLASKLNRLRLNLQTDKSKPV